MSITSHNPAQTHAALTHLFECDLLIFGRFLFCVSSQATRSPLACRRAASAEAPAPPCARAVTTSWTAEGKDLPPFQPTCQTAWLRCKHRVFTAVSAVTRPHAVKEKIGVVQLSGKLKTALGGIMDRDLQSD